MSGRDISLLFVNSLLRSHIERVMNQNNIELYKGELSELLVFSHSLGLKCLDVSLYRESTFKIRQNV